MKHIKTLWFAILAGIAIGIGGTVNLSSGNKIIGAFMFSIGLLIIVTSKLNLFTGKIGYLLENKLSYIIDLIIIWIGNFIGTWLVAFSVRTADLNISADALSEAKLNNSWLNVFILSIFCGILMYLAVNSYKEISDPLGKYILVILPVAVFIISGFEHCIANMFYFSLANVWSLKAVGYILIMTLGNAIGSWIFAVHKKFIKE